MDKGITPLFGKGRLVKEGPPLFGKQRLVRTTLDIVRQFWSHRIWRFHFLVASHEALCLVWYGGVISSLSQ